MIKLQQRVLPIKLELSHERLTSMAGLVIRTLRSLRAEKREAEWTYQKVKGYQPQLGLCE